METNIGIETGLYWIETACACGGVIVENGIIIDSAPYFKKFINQPITNLLSWRLVLNSAKIISDKKTESRIL